MGWYNETKTQGSSGSGKFFKLGDGDKAKVIVLGEPWKKETHWVGGKTETCTGPGCEFCAEGIKRSQRFALQVYSMTEKCLQIWEMPWGVYNDLGEEIADWGDQDCAMQIRRTGTGKDTRYKLRAGKVDSDTLETAKSEFEMPHDLTEYGFEGLMAAAPKAMPMTPDAGDDSDLPF